MGDVDEDVLTSPGLFHDDGDPTDEPQDFSFLSSLSLTEHPSLPRRGDKDFEPHGTSSQQDALSRAQAAMHDALSYPRIHTPKYRITALYQSGESRVVVENPKGHHFRTMGKVETDGRLYLLPEEALYLVERGNLDLRWPAEEGDCDEGLPLSLQSAYAALIGQPGLTLERYTVYTGLKRSGYIVQRGPAWYPADAGIDEVGRLSPLPKSSSAFEWLYALLRRRDLEIPPPLGPLVRPGLYRTYREIYSSLNLVSFHDPVAYMEHKPPTALQSVPALTDLYAMGSEGTPAHVRCSFYVWKPRPDFRKSFPGPPDFRIAVVNAREDHVPRLEQFDQLLQSVPYAPPPATMATQVYQKLKHGWRSVILAIVDQGVVSYLQVSDAGFGKQKMFERTARGLGGKQRGGTARGRGRGVGMYRGR
ncbi:tRNA-splicing endonuclease subunit sen54 [Lambiella insularis]|nr:tRNA-splicing endonuclease subunit sen54 [Lambiella insularis]